MKRVFSFACLFSFTLAVLFATQATTVSAQGAPKPIASEADYSTHMKEIGQLNGVFGKGVKGGMADEAMKAAERMEVLFKNVHAYWNEKKVTDASTAAQTVLTNLAAAQKALKANDMAAAETARAAVAAQCMACHTAHREKTPEGGFKMK